MTTQDIIGKTIVDIYTSVTPEAYGLDFSESFIKLDTGIFICFPFGCIDENLQTVPSSGARSIFKSLSGIPVHFVNKDNKTIGEIADNFKNQKSSWISKLKGLFLGKNTIPKEYEIYKTEIWDNPLKYIKGQKIVDFLWYADDADKKGFLLLENGFLITATDVAPHGTGLAGVNIFASIDDLSDAHGDGYSRLSSSNMPSTDKTVGTP